MKEASNSQPNNAASPTAFPRCFFRRSSSPGHQLRITGHAALAVISHTGNSLNVIATSMRAAVGLVAAFTGSSTVTGRPRGGPITAGTVVPCSWRATTSDEFIMRPSSSAVSMTTAVAARAASRSSSSIRIAGCNRDWLGRR